MFLSRSAIGSLVEQLENKFQLSLQSMFLVVLAIAVPLALLRVSFLLGFLAVPCSSILLVAYLSRSTFGDYGWFSECLLKATLAIFVIGLCYLSVSVLSEKYFPSNEQIAFEAVETNDLERLQSVILKVDIDATNLDRLTLLNMAVVRSSPDVVAFLLDKGSDPNQRGGLQEWTPLQRVVYYNIGVSDAVEIIKLLIEHGADPALTEADGKMLIYYADSRSVEIANALRWKPDQTNE